MTKPASPYSVGLEKTSANYAALSPLSFLAKAGAVYPERIALIHGQRRISWAETYARCRRLACALQRCRPPPSKGWSVSVSILPMYMD